MIARTLNVHIHFPASLVSWVYFMACSRENHKTAVALSIEAGERFGMIPMLPHLKLDPETEDVYENLPRYVVERFPGLLEALWDNMDGIHCPDQSDELTAFLHEVAELMGMELGFGDFGQKVVRPKSPLKGS